MGVRRGRPPEDLIVVAPPCTLPEVVLSLQRLEVCVVEHLGVELARGNGRDGLDVVEVDLAHVSGWSRWLRLYTSILCWM